MNSLKASITALTISVLSNYSYSSSLSTGSLFIAVADFGKEAVYQINDNTTLTKHASGLKDPIGLATSKNGKLYVVQAQKGEITDITQAGDYSNTKAHAWGFEFNQLRNLLINKDGKMLVTNRDKGTVIDITMGGHRDKQPLFAWGLSGARDIYETKDGRILAVEQFSGEITDITKGGDFTNAKPFAYGLRNPYALAQSANGDLYVSENINNGNVYNISNGGLANNIFASGLNGTDEILFLKNGTFLAVQEYDKKIIDITQGGSQNFPTFAKTGRFPQQMAEFNTSEVPIPASIWLFGISILSLFHRKNK